MRSTSYNRNQYKRALHNYQLIITDVIKLLANTHYSKNQQRLQ